MAVLLRMPEATVRGYAYNLKRKRVPPAAGRAIVRLVLAHKGPTGPLDLWEESPGFRDESVVWSRRRAGPMA
ncbi:MAG: hypothetical protein WD757_05870 [Actinomycetota bacterium]